MPRLGHKKSRLGCRQCKARHVKCDELKPCSNCTRHGVPCSLLASDSTESQPPPAQPAHASTSTSPRQHSSDTYGSAPASTPSPSLPPVDSVMNIAAASPKLEGTPSSAFSRGSPHSSQSDHFPFLSNFIHKTEFTQSDIWLRDLELMHHWTAEAFETLSSRDDCRNTWKVEAPKHAVSHSFMMHELLAFAAFHKAYKTVAHRTDYYSFGIRHQDLAIRGMREKLHNVLPNEAVALVATSTLLTLSVFASTGFEANISELGITQCPIDGILNIYNLMQGMGNVLALAYMSVVGSFLAPIFRDPLEPCLSQPMLQELSSHVPTLITFIQGKRDLPESERTVYLSVVSQFEPIVQYANAPRVDNRELRFLFYWPLHVDHIFIGYMRQRHSGALVILMYYATILFASETRYWFLEGWGDRLMRACYESVDQSWVPAIQWPISFLNRGSSFESFADLIQQSQGLGVPAHLALARNTLAILPHRQYAPFPSTPHDTRTSARTAPYPQHGPSASSPPERKPNVNVKLDYGGLPAPEEVD